MSGKFTPRGESDLRSILRSDTIKSIKNSSHDLTLSQNYVSEWINTFGDDFRITIQFIVPIALPPNRKVGHCRATLDRILERILIISDGYIERDVRGGWTDGDYLFTEKSILIEASIRLDLWAEIPEIMRRVVDDIQRDLRQKCVYVTIDNVPFGDPIDLVGADWSKYPNFEEFGDVDRDCLERKTGGSSVTEDSMSPLDLTQLKIANQTVNSNSVSSNIAGGNVYNYNFGSGQDISQIQQLIAALELNVEKPDENITAVVDAQEFRARLEENNVKVDPHQDLRLASKLVSSGDLDQAEGIYKKVMRKFTLVDDMLGIAKTNYHIGYLEMTRGEHKTAAIYHEKAFQTFSVGGHNRFAKATETQLGNCFYYNYEDERALEIFLKSRDFELEMGNPTNVFTSQYMIAQYSMINGDFEKGRKQLSGCLRVFQQGNSDWHLEMQLLTHKALAWVEYFQGNLSNSILEFERLFEISHSPRFESCMHAALGRLYIESGDYEKAEKHHRKCIQIRLLQGSRLGEWYERHRFTSPNSKWNYPPSDLSEERYDLMWPR